MQDERRISLSNSTYAELKEVETFYIEYFCNEQCMDIGRICTILEGMKSLRKKESNALSIRFSSKRAGPNRT